MTTRPVGETNGWQAALFRVNLIVLPICVSALIALAVWLVVEQFETQKELAVLAQRMESFIAAGPRYTPIHAERDHLRWREEVLESVAEQYPPDWLRSEVESTSRRLEAIERTMLKNDR